MLLIGNYPEQQKANTERA